MCGIAGELSSAEFIDKAIEKKVLMNLHHRGPDAYGFRSIKRDESSYLHLYHTRLSIIDLSAEANQPFFIGNHCLIFNGELYNYLELRIKLTSMGVTFRTNSDTEVFAQMLIQYGINGLEECEGMWAFAFLNGDTREFFLGRDRIGEKPLMYTKEGNTFRFASEIGALEALTKKRFKPNSQQLMRYLYLGYRSLYKSCETYFENVFQVPAGSVLRFAKNTSKPEVIKYWRPVLSCNNELGRKFAIQKTKEILLDSLEKSLRSDVPLAFSLSGGVDSTVLVSLAKKELNKEIHAFTVANTGSEYDEKSMVINTVKELGIEHDWVNVDFSNFLNNLTELVKIHNAPVGTVTYYVQWRLMELVRNKGYKVVVSGTGADEIFSGYYDHHLAFFHDLKRSKSDLRQQAINNWEKTTGQYIRNPNFRNPDFLSHTTDLGEYLYDYSANKSFMNDQSWKEDFYQEPYCGELLRNRMMNELCHESVPLILAEDDLNSMSFSIENRSPFLNSELMNFAQSIPSEHLFFNGVAKSILREAGRGIAPDQVLDKVEKVGFNAPLRSLIDLQDRSIQKFLLSDSPIFEYTNYDKIKELVENSESAYRNSKFLFAYVNAKIFLENVA